RGRALSCPVETETRTRTAQSNRLRLNKSTATAGHARSRLNSDQYSRGRPSLMDRLYTLAFSTLLYGIAVVMKFTAWRHPAFRDRLKEQDVIGQIRIKGGAGRYYVIKNGKLTSRRGIHPNPDVVITFKSARL